MEKTLIQRLQLAFLRSPTTEEILDRLLRTIPSIGNFDKLWCMRELTALYLIHRTFSMHLKEPQDIPSMSIFSIDDIEFITTLSSKVLNHLLNLTGYKAATLQGDQEVTIALSDAKTGKIVHKNSYTEESQHCFAEAMSSIAAPHIKLKGLCDEVGMIKTDLPPSIIHSIEEAIEEAEAKEIFSSFTPQPSTNL